MAQNHVQSQKAVLASGTSLSKAFDSNVTAGNAILVCVDSWKIGALGTLSCVDNNGNPYRLLAFTPSNFSGGAPTGSQSQAAIFIALNVAAGATTVTVSSTVASSLDLTILEYTNVALINPLEQCAVNMGSGGQTITLHTQLPNCILFAHMFNQSRATDTWTFSAGWTQRQNTSNTTPGVESVSGDNIVTSVGQYSNTITPSGGGTVHMLMVALSDTNVAGYLPSQSVRGATVTGTTLALTTPAAVTSGHLLVAFMGAWDSGGGLGTISITDSNSNSWTLIGPTTLVGASKAYAYYCTNPNAGATTLTFTSTVAETMVGILLEYPLSVASITSSFASATTSTSLTATVGWNTTFAIGCGFNQSNTNTLPAAFSCFGWKERGSQTSGSRTKIDSFDQLFLGGDIALTISGSSTNPIHSFLLLAAAPTTNIVWPSFSFGPAVIGVAYSQQWDLAPAAAPTTYTLATGSLPPGLSLSNVSGDIGQISGTPTTAGTYNFTLLATNAFGTANSPAFTIVVSAASGGSFTFAA